MGSWYIIIPVAVLAIAVLAILVIVARRGKKTNDRKNKILKSRDRSSIVREANRRLSQNPKDADALQALADLYFQEEDFAKAMKTYGLLVELCATNREISEFEVTIRYAVSALRLGKHSDAYKSLVIASSMEEEDSFELNFNLGYLEYLRKNYEKAASLLSLARKEQPEHPGTLKYLGLSLYRIKRFSEAGALLVGSLKLAPEDKETQFALGRAYSELNQNEKALRIFTHLRPDPELGPTASLYAGTLRMKSRDFQQAILDFEIGLRHENIQNDVRLELKYRLATAYVQTQNLSDAIRLFEELYLENPDYKDVKDQISKFKELSLNQNLQTFLLGTTSDFVALCRKLAALFFLDAKVKVIDVSVQKTEHADILAEVSGERWEDLVLFRFVRTGGQIGELVLRDMHARIKELRAGRGFCISAGSFSEGAQQFVEARLIDLVEKNGLTKKLNQLGKRSV